MKVMHVLAYAPVGGIEVYTRDLFAALEAAGHSNVIVTTGDNVDNVATESRPMVTIADLTSRNGRGTAASLSAIDNVVSTHKPDVAFLHTVVAADLADHITAALPTVWFAHEYGPFCPSGSLLYARSDRICELRDTPNWRCIVNAYREHCNTRHPVRLVEAYRRSGVAQRLAKRANAIVCDSNYVSHRYAQAGFRPDSIHVLPSPVQLPEISATEQSTTSLLFAGRLVHHKGLQVLLSAMPSINPDATLRVAGEGHDEARLRGLAKKLHLDDRVEFVGRVSRQEIATMYRDSTAVVVPSVWPEPLGMVGLEAMSWQKPVVGSRIGGITDWLDDETTGLAFAAGDARHLASQVNRVLDDPALRRRLGSAARDVIAERFTFPGHVTRLVAVFERAIANFASGVTAG